jgi:gliding motility-associated-like protein
LPQPPPINISFEKSTYTGNYNISCKGYNDGWAQATVTGGNPGGYTYLWTTTDGTITGPANTSRIDNLTAGTYTLTVTDSKNCPWSQSVTLTEPAGMDLSDFRLSLSNDLNFNISCNGYNNGSIDITVSGGSGSYTYLWAGPGGFSSTNRSISNLVAGTYTVTVTDMSNTTCILMPKPSFTLTEPAPLTVAATRSYSIEGSHSINCAGGTGSITLAVNGGSTGNYTYNWTTSNGSGIVQGQKDQLNNLTAGTYTVTVTDMNGCTAQATETLTQPSPLAISLSSTPITCNPPGFNNGAVNLTVSGGVAPYNFSWSNGASTEDLSNLSQGTYRVIVTDMNGCWKEDSVTLTNPPPIAYSYTSSDYNGFNISCYGKSDGSVSIVTTSGQPPYTYSWTGPFGFTSTSPDISGLRAGQYVLNIIDNSMCTATGTFNLTEPGDLYMNVVTSKSLDGDYNINCYGSSTATITVNPVNNAGGVSYLWSDGITGQTRTDLPAGSYRVIILDLNNCIADTTVNITQPDSISLSFDVKQAFCPDSPDGELTVNPTGGVMVGDYKYKWSDGSTTRTITNILKGIYTVVVTDANNCTASDSVNMQPLNESCLVVPNAISPNSDNINDIWNIGMKHLYPQMEVKIYNRWGEEIWRSAKGYPDPWDGKSNGTALPMDSYHYTIDLHNGSKLLVGTITIVK